MLAHFGARAECMKTPLNATRRTRRHAHAIWFLLADSECERMQLVFVFFIKNIQKYC